MNIKQIAVIGAGQMGSGVAQVAAQSGIEVILLDIEKAYAVQGYRKIDKHLSRQVEKNKLTASEKDGILSRIRVSANLSEASVADMVIEAVVEQLDAKTRLLRQLDSICRQHTILATNTSSLSVTHIAAATKRPDQVIGMHFMNPVPVMELVEVIRGLATSDATHATTVELAKKLGKKPETVGDFPGFAANRILLPMINEAIYAVYEGVASPEAIDQIMVLGANHRMGPLALADLIGLDTCLAIMETLQRGFGDDKYRPCPLLRRYVQAGWLGRKTGRGFYAYEEGSG